MFFPLPPICALPPPRQLEKTQIHIQTFIILAHLDNFSLWHLILWALLSDTVANELNEFELKHWLTISKGAPHADPSCLSRSLHVSPWEETAWEFQALWHRQWEYI